MKDFKPSFNIDALVNQFKDIKPSAKAVRKVGEKAETISSRRSISGFFPTMLSLHEYSLVTFYNKIDESDPARDAKVQAMCNAAMDTEYPATKNTTGVRTKELKVVRADAEGKPMMVNGKPITRQYNNGHYTWYKQHILGNGLFKYAEELGLTDDDIKAAIDTYHATRKGEAEAGDEPEDDDAAE